MEGSAPVETATAANAVTDEQSNGKTCQIETSLHARGM